MQGDKLISTPKRAKMNCDFNLNIRNILEEYKQYVQQT